MCGVLCWGHVTRQHIFSLDLWLAQACTEHLFNDMSHFVGMIMLHAHSGAPYAFVLPTVHLHKI